MASEDASKPPQLDPATAPDPDEDDLDDLDEMLDDFSSTKIQDTKPPPAAPSSSTAPTASGPGRPGATDEASTAPGAGDEDDFAKQLQAGFADMLKDLESNPDMAKQFEELMAQFSDSPGANAASDSAPPSAAKAPPAASTSDAPATTSKASPAPAPKIGEENFQDTIRKTMERMKASDSSASTATPAAGEADMMASLLKELASAEGGDGDDTMSKMLLGMMEQLTNKEVLYEPMKELDTKFPAWLKDNGATLSQEDKDRYHLQKVLVGEIVKKFESKGYSDNKTEDREYIVERMQKMQAAGAPPPDLVGDVNAAEEMFGGAGGPDAGCPQQ